jgi:hypothetical protein
MSQMSSQTAPEPKGPYLNFVEGFGYAGSGALAALVLMVLVIAAVKRPWTK